MVCAALRLIDFKGNETQCYVLGAHYWDRHMRLQIQALVDSHIIASMQQNWQQGFIDQFETFMLPDEAAQVAYAANQVNHSVESLTPNDLY